MQVEREEGEDRVLAADEQAAPEREQTDVTVAGRAGAARAHRGAVPVATLDTRERQRDEGRNRDGRSADEAPAPAREVRDPGQQRSRDEPADRDPRLADPEGKPVAVAREGEQDEAPARGRGGRAR